MRCVSGCNAVTLSSHRIGFLEKKYWLFRADILHGPMQIYCNGCRRYLKWATQYYCYGNWDLFYSRKARQSRQKLRAIFREIREREIINLCVLFGRCTQRSYPPHYSLLATHCSKCSFVEKYSQLIAHWPSLNVKHFYFCPQFSHWCQNEQKPLKIVQKQT